MLTDDAYELWDTASHNLVGTYPTQEDALEIVRSAIRRHGEGCMLTIALEGEDELGESQVLAVGLDLIRLAFPQTATVFVAS